MQSNHLENELFSQSSFRKSAFSLIRKITITGINNEKNENLVNANQRQLASINCSKLVNSEGEIWQPQEIGRLFGLYDIYGPQWKVMSHQMTGRTANNLKNRFYTVLRNLVKLLFRKCPENCPRLPGEIPSKDLCRLYDGKEDYLPFAGLLSTVLSEMEFNLECENFGKIVEKHSIEIQSVYHAIYGERARSVGEQAEIKSEMKGFNFPTCSSLDQVEDIEKNLEQTETITATKKSEVKPKGAHQEIVFLVFLNPPEFYFPNQP